MKLNKTASAECFIVTDLSTYWQRKFSWLPFNKDRQNIAYKITIDNGRVQIEPSVLDCVLANSSSISNSIHILCGSNISFEKNESTNQTDSGKADLLIELTKTKGNVKESWQLHKDLGIAIVTVYDGKAKMYNGILRTAR